MSSRLYCWLASRGIVDDDCDFAPRYRPDPAHLGFTRRWLTGATGPRLPLEQADDDRIRRPVCRKHHGQLDNPNHPLSLTREQLPASVEAYAEEFDLVWRLDDLFPPTDEGETVGSLERD